MKECILCKSKNVETVQVIETAMINKLYKDLVNLDIIEELKNKKNIHYYNCRSCGLFFFNPIFAGSGKFYEELQLKRNSYYNPNREEFNYSLKFINNSDKVLEIGSGSGFFAKKLNLSNYTGLEFNDEAIYKAREKNINLIKKSIEVYSNESVEKYDIVCSFHVLEHVQYPFAFLNSSLKMLNENGKLIIAVPCNDSVLTSNHNHTLNFPPHHLSRWNIQTMKNLATIFNLNLLEYKIVSNSKELNQKEYFKFYALKKVLNIFYPKNKIIIEPIKITKIKRYVNFLINKLRLDKLFNKKHIIGENMVFIFEKNKL